MIPVWKPVIPRLASVASADDFTVKPRRASIAAWPVSFPVLLRMASVVAELGTLSFRVALVLFLKTGLSVVETGATGIRLYYLVLSPQLFCLRFFRFHFRTFWESFLDLRLPSAPIGCVTAGCFSLLWPSAECSGRIFSSTEFGIPVWPSFASVGWTGHFFRILVLPFSRSALLGIISGSGSTEQISSIPVWPCSFRNYRLCREDFCCASDFFRYDRCLNLGASGLDSW